MRTIYTACGEEIRVEGGGCDREREYGRVTDDGGRGIPPFVEAETVAALDTRMSAARRDDDGRSRHPRWPRERS
jgi:hypothetical protein